MRATVGARNDPIPNAMKLLVLALFALALSFAPAPDAAPPQDALRPAPQHRLLERRVGTWEATLVSRDPAGAEVRTRGTLRVRELADFHTLEDFEGEFMGMEMLGHGVTSWCPIRQRFLSTWVDSMTPSPMQLSGDYDAERDELTLRGECFGPSGKLEPCRTVTRFVDERHFTWALYGSGDAPLLRIEYAKQG